MAANRVEATKSPASNGANGAEAAPAPEAVVPAVASGGIKSWLPLLANIILMPVLAYVTTTFLLIPKLQSAAAQPSLQAGAVSGEKAELAAAHGEGKKEGGKIKVIAPLSGKVLVNLAGTMGTRYLLANITLVGSGSEFKSIVEKNDPQLRDVAASTLSTKTIPDLEKPGARNLIRTELISVFNNVLGNGTVADIYLTEFAIQ